MADIRRDVGDVSPRTFIRQGVQDDSASTIAAGLAQAGIGIDVELAKDRLESELDSLRTTYEVSSPAAIAVQEGAPPLSPADQQEITRLEKELKVGQAARDQGRLKFNSYRLRGERALRIAISKRPGLAQEFRALAAQTLGTDVVGASIDVLAAGEADLMKQAKAKAEEQEDAIKRMRQDLDTYAGVITGGLSDEQVVEQYQFHLDGMTQAKRAKIVSETSKNLAATQEAGQTLRRPDATLNFVDASAEAKADLYAQVGRVKFALESPTVPIQDKEAILLGSRASVQQKISELNALASRGDIEPAIAEREIASLKTLGEMLDQVATGQTGAEINETAVRGITAYAQHVLMSSSDEVPYLSASVRAFGPEIMSQYYGPTGQFNKVVPLAIGKAMAGTGNPTVTAASAADAVSSTMKAVFDPGNPDPQKVQETADLYQKLAESFVVVPDSAFRQSQFNGPSGYAAKLYLHRETLAKALAPEQAAEVATSLAAATYNAQRVMTAALFQKYPSLRGKVSVAFHPDTGKLYSPLAETAAGQPVSLSSFEEQAIAQWNQEFGGDRLITTIARIGYPGKSGQEAREAAVKLVYQYQGYVEEARKGSQRAVEARTGAGSTQGSSPTPQRAPGSLQGRTERWWEQ